MTRQWTAIIEREGDDYVALCRDIVKCCGWRGAHPDRLSGGFNVSILEFDTLDDEFNELVTV